jgi:hypothetical protein
MPVLLLADRGWEDVWFRAVARMADWLVRAFETRRSCGSCRAVAGRVGRFGVLAAA